MAKTHARKAGREDLTEFLSSIPFNSLTPILVETMRSKSEMIDATDLLREAEAKKDFFFISDISQKELCRFRQLYFQIMPDYFESVQLPPIAPLGICTALTKLGQNERLATIRKSEVISDSTLALAMQAAILRKQQCKDGRIYQDVSLASFHRLLRLQRFDPEKRWSQHFEILGTITTGRRKGKNSFRNEAIRAHVKMWIDFFNVLNANDYDYQNIQFTFSSVDLMEWIVDRFDISREEVNKNSLKDAFDYFESYDVSLPRKICSIRELRDILCESKETENIYKQLVQFEEDVLEPLRKSAPHVDFRYELDRKLGFGYFNGICFHGYAVNSSGEQFDLIDGGSSDWVGQMLSDKHEVTVTSSFGVEVGIAQFKKR